MLSVTSIATVSTGVLVVCCALLFSGGNQRDHESYRYSVVVEGGSTVSRVHVYTYQVESGKPVSEFMVVGYYNAKLHPGLSAYANDPHAARISLKKLVESAKGWIPKRKWKETEVRLMAAAGKSLLKKSVQEKFLKVTRRVLESSGFMFRDEWASITSGSEDDINAWAVTNLALGSRGGDPAKVRGYVELMEASRLNEKIFVQRGIERLFVASRGPKKGVEMTVVWRNKTEVFAHHQVQETKKVFAQGQTDAGGGTSLLTIMIVVLVLVVVISLRK